MIKQYIAIVLNDKILAKVLVEAKTTDQGYEQAFDYADSMFGPNDNYELFELGNPRHQVLFNKELSTLF